MKKLTHEEILSKRLTAEEALGGPRHPVYVLLHNVRSLYNVGSVFRTCDSSLVAELILSGFTPHPPRKEIEKTALGAVDSVPWQYFKDFKKAIQYFKSKKIKVIAAEITDSSVPYDSLSLKDFPIALIFGNEIKGLPQDLLDDCDTAIEIPMYGVKHSLNVAVSAGIAIYESIRIINS